MKFKIKTEVLRERLKDSLLFTNKSNKIPSLANVIIHATEESILLIGTDLITEGIIEIKENIEILKTGKVLTDTIKLLNILKLTDKEEIILETEGNSLIYTDENSMYELYTFDTEGFSYFNLQHENFSEISLNTKNFKKALQEVVFTAKNTAFRAYLTGINILTNNNIIKFVSSDNFRLSSTEIPILNEVSNNINKIIPKKTALHILKFLETFNENEITFKISEKYFSIQIDDLTINSKLIDDIYPDITPILNREYPTAININKEEFFQSLRKASIFSVDENTPVTLNFELDKITFYSEDVASGRSKTTMNVDYKNEPLKFSIKPSYLFDIEKLIISDKFNFKLIEVNLPILVEDPENLNFKYLIQPTQL